MTPEQTPLHEFVRHLNTVAHPVLPIEIAGDRAQRLRAPVARTGGYDKLRRCPVPAKGLVATAAGER